ncbi:MAG TPA: hypothetical protein VFD43_10435 [Planctomycetota bacterium]|nr:hypothetical protein [Planctomycetota bacterium]
MKLRFIPWAAAAVLLIFALARPGQFLADFKTGLLLGAVLVVLVVLPWFLRNHERRLSALERERDAQSPPRG